MTWTHGFHREEGIVCFNHCLALDPDCAMAHWAIAFCHGPNYNMNGDRYVGLSKTDGFPSMSTAFRHATAAQAALTDGSSPTETALINALVPRYVADWDDVAPNTDGNAVLTGNPELDTLNHAFVAACREAVTASPDNVELHWCLAEGLMNCRPWQLWDVTTGEQAPETAEIVEHLTRGLALSPTHPGLCHSAIHCYEQSPFPERALPSCDVLRPGGSAIVPDCGHLLHMPSHIDVLVGNYEAAVVSNAAAIVADLKAIELGGIHANGMTVGFTAHNHHMLVYAAMLAGMVRPAAPFASSRVFSVLSRPQKRCVRACSQEEQARSHATSLQKHIGEARLRMPLAAEGAEAHCALELHVLIRFGKWEEILDWPAPADPVLWCATVAQRHFARGIAYAALGKVNEARAEQASFRVSLSEPTLATRRVHNNMVTTLLEIAEEMLEGEVLYRSGEFDAAFAKLEKGVALEDALAYDEPWGWMSPVRHALGALLLEQGRVAEAESVYRADLAPGRHPNNVWALHGLHACVPLPAPLRSALLPFALLTASAWPPQMPLGQRGRRRGE